MRRKVVKHGTATLTISLPSKWVKRFGVKAGDELDVVENNQILTISTDKNAALDKTEIDLDKLGLFNKNFLSNIYQMGYDEVKITYDSVDTYQEIVNRLSNCIGFEIINQGERYCEIKSIAEISHTEFDKVLSRTFLILLSMSRDCLEAIRGKQFSRLAEIRAMEAVNNKLTDYCRRILNKKGYKDPKKTTALYSVVHDLEKIADDYKHICDLLKHRTKPVSKDIIGLFEDVHEFLDTFYHLYYKFDMSRTRHLFDHGKTIIDNGYAMMAKRTHEETLLIHHLVNLTTKVYELTLPYFQMQF